MEYLITKRQFNLVNEQWWNDPKHPEWKKYAPTDYEKRELKKSETVLNNLDPHTIATIFSIGTAFIPVVGPFISASIGLADAALYYKEGDKNAAGLTAAFSMIPFIGMIPGVKQLGSKGMAMLASKVAKGSKSFTASEIQVLNAIKENESLIRKGLEDASTKLSPITKEIQSLKPGYVSRFGQEKYETLLKEFLSGKSDKQFFLQSLKSAKKASPNLANFVSKFGIKFAKEEMDQITSIAKNAFDVGIQKVKLQTKNGPRLIRVYSVPREVVEKNLPANASAQMFADTANDGIYIIKDNVSNLSGKQLEDVLVHEFAHIKDPSIVKSPKFINLYNTRAVKGIEDWANAAKLRELERSGVTGLSDKASKLEKSGVEKYYLNPNEIIANNTMVIQNLATNTSHLKNIMTKDQIMKGLDGIIDFAKGKSKTWSDDAAKLLGYNDPDIFSHFEKLIKKPSEYRKLWTKLAQQADYLKSQIKIAM
jgi:predicted metal-dependent hydrolase